MIPLPATGYLVAAAFLAGAVSAYKVMDWKQQAEEKRDLQATLALQGEVFKVRTRIERRVYDRLVEVKTQGEEVVREVPVIVTREVEQACPGGLPRGFVRLHDAAVANRTAGGPSLTDADPAGVTIARGAETVAGNYTEYHVCREQVIGWNEYYNALRAKLGAAPAPP